MFIQEKSLIITKNGTNAKFSSSEIKLIYSKYFNELSSALFMTILTIFSSDCIFISYYNKVNRGERHSLENVVCYRKDNPAGTQFQSSPSVLRLQNYVMRHNIIFTNEEFLYVYVLKNHISIMTFHRLMDDHN